MPITSISINSSSYKNVSFNIGCTEYGYFTYHIARTYAYNTSACGMNTTAIQYWVGMD